MLPSLDPAALTAITPIEIPNLTVSGCRARQERLRNALVAEGLDAALVCDRAHVYYLTGYWCRSIYAPLVWLERGGPTVLSVPFASPWPVAADELVEYEANRIGTLVEDQCAAAAAPLARRFAGVANVGSDGPSILAGLSAGKWRDLGPVFRRLRRTKDEDEVAMLRCAIAATEVAYGYALAALQPGVSEVALFAGMQAVVAAAIGENVGEFGNDFQVCSPGGGPRRRLAARGEMAIFDLGVAVRGYNSDMSRSFVVGGEPSEPQQQAQQRIALVLAKVEGIARAGVRCRDLYPQAAELLDGYQGWKFGHHLGHGIGLAPHESPRLNPNWDDTLQAGDVITVEPGLYGENLRAGLRIENDYLVTPGGLERLSRFPIALS